MLTRKVKIFEWKPAVDSDGKPKLSEANNTPHRYHEKVKTGVGLFHQWGSDYEEFETGPGNYSTAIVEMEDGTIKNVPCDMVQFIL